MRLGYESDFTEVDTIRFGYVYHSSPSPDSTLNPYLDGVLQMIAEELAIARNG